MKAGDFWLWCERQMPDAPHADVVVVDEEGFVHVVDGLYWDSEDCQWVIRTRFQADDEVTQDGPGYPAQ